MAKVITGDDRIDGLLTSVGGPANPVLSWQTTNELGTGVSLDISFLSGATNGVSGFDAMDAAMQADTMIALQHFSDIANVTFNLVAAGTGDLNFGTAALPSGESSYTAGTAYYGYSYNSQFAYLTNANIYLTNTAAGYDEANVGDASYTTLLHEIAHSLGIEHPFEGTLVPVGTDSDQYTLMSYTEYFPYGTNPASLMLYDMMAIQYLYGANHNYNSGDTVIDIAAFLADGPRALWDGAGEDTIDLSNMMAGKTFDLNEGAFNTVTNTNDFVIAFGAAIENLIGTAFDDLLTGTSSANKLTGLDGADTIYGNGGSDKVYSGDGDDEVYLGNGSDFALAGNGVQSFFGGNGTDTISYYDSNGGVTLDLASNSASRSWANNDSIENFENATGSRTGNDNLSGTSGANTLKSHGGSDKLYGRSGADKLYGGADADLLQGDGGTDRLYGGSGKDSLYGGSGDDTLYGSSGADSLFGGNGDDKLNGGGNADRLDGGNGNDIFDGGAGADTFHIDHGKDNDTISDFEDDTDLIQLDNFTFAGGLDAFDFATEIDGNVIFDFGDGDTLTVLNATISQLGNDLEMV